MKVGFIGVGKLGQDAAEVMAEHHDVVGYDVEKRNPANFKMVDTIEEVCKDREVIFIAVPTPHSPEYDGRYPCTHLDPMNFDYSIVKSVLDEVDKYTSKEQLVVLISTVLPGTIREHFDPTRRNFRFLYNPYLIAMGTVKEDMVDPEMIIIGNHTGQYTGDVKLLIQLYSAFVKEGTRVETGTWEEAEAIKIFYNTFISAKIGLVNMIQDTSMKIGNMDTDVITGALERSTYRILGPAYMKAGMGDGGACHPRDNIALRHLANSNGFGYDLFEAIMYAREMQAYNLAAFIYEQWKHEASWDEELPVYILGKSYKPGVDYEDGSYSVLVADMLEKQFPDKLEVEFDPENPKKGIYLLGHRGEFHAYHFPAQSVVIDPWREMSPYNKTIYVIHYGNTRYHKTFNERKNIQVHHIQRGYQKSDS